MTSVSDKSMVRSEAVFSPCRQYRFWLCREWGIAEPFGVFLLHNPSVAGALWIDPTLAKCNNLAVQWGWRGFGIVNLQPNVSAKMSPRTTISAAIVAENDIWMNRARKLADVFVIGTGGNISRRTLSAALGTTGPFYGIKENSNRTFLHPRGVNVEANYPAPVPVTIP